MMCPECLFMEGEHAEDCLVDFEISSVKGRLLGVYYMEEGEDLFQFVEKARNKRPPDALT